MADLSSLKQRVELVDLRLKTAHGARERESAALMETWEQIRDRFVEQNAEIAQLRDRVGELEDARDDLLQMVHGLLSAVEGGLDRMSDESVPQIRTMAANLLAESSGHCSCSGRGSSRIFGSHFQGSRVAPLGPAWPIWIAILACVC